MRVALAVALLALLPVPAFADTAKPDPAKPKKQRKPRPVMQPSAPTDGDGIQLTPDRPLPKTQHREGEYGGVTPGQTPTEQKGRKKVPPKSTLLWVGFEAKDGGALVFLQAAGPFSVEQHVEGATLVAEVDLPRLAANAWRQVDTRFFENPLSGIVARSVSAHGATKTAPARKGGIEVRFTFKNAADAKAAAMRTNTEADGLFYTYLTFPQGTAVPGAATAPVKSDVEK